MTFKNARKWSAALIAAAALITARNASAQNLPAPSSGLQILDLAGGAITTDALPYSADFEATTSFSTLTFVFRHDPGFFTLTNVSVTDQTTGDPTNLLVNGNFLTGAPTSPGDPVPGWTYFIQAGNLYPQYLGNENGVGFFDGSTQAYDGIDQGFTTAVGDVYSVNFGLQSDTSGGIYQQTSNNGGSGTDGNGIDAVVYAGNGIPPTTVPDAASTFLLVLGGLAAIAVIGMRQPAKSAL